MVIKQIGVTDREGFWGAGRKFYWYKFVVCNSVDVHSTGTIRTHDEYTGDVRILNIPPFTSNIIYKD
jgi:hypothetical protein